GRPALQGKAGARGRAGSAAQGRHEHSAGRARHGLCHESDRPHRGHGLRHQDRGRHSGGNPDQSGRARSVSGWYRRRSGRDARGGPLRNTVCKRRARSAHRRNGRRRFPMSSANKPKHPILKVTDLTARYGKVTAVSGANIMVVRGSIVTVIGANGAGKSTLLNSIMGSLPLSGSCTGTIEYLGGEIGNWQVERRVASGVSLVPERRELFGSMS